MKSEIITREQAVEIMIRPLPQLDGFLDRMIESCKHMSDSKFMLEFRKATKLRLKNFSEKKYQIVW